MRASRKLPPLVQSCLYLIVRRSGARQLIEDQGELALEPVEGEFRMKVAAVVLLALVLSGCAMSGPGELPHLGCEDPSLFLGCTEGGCRWTPARDPRNCPA